jgi:hypothetical protein
MMGVISDNPNISIEEAVIRAKEKRMPVSSRPEWVYRDVITVLTKAGEIVVSQLPNGNNNKNHRKLKIAPLRATNATHA